MRWLFEFCARYLYPEGYRFDENDLLEFERGYAHGYTRPKRNIHLEKFDTMKDVMELRREWSIDTLKVL